MFPFTKKLFLSATQLKRLGEHKYKCESCSLLDPHLQGYWNWLVSTVPLWVAPNLLTMVGLLVNILTTLLLVWYSPDAKSEAPSLVYLLCGAGLFIYQSLDSIDGKQARRTNSQSPLGELFDHGCDSVSIVFIALGACIAVNLGNNPLMMFIQCFYAIVLFYCAHWQTYVSGVFRIGRIDVTESLFTMMSIQLISAVLGSSFWSYKVVYLDVLAPCYALVVATTVCATMSLVTLFTVIVTGGVGKNGSTVALPLLDVSLETLPAISGIFLATYVLCCNLKVIFTGGVGKNGSSVAGTSVLSPAIPLFLVVVPAFIIYRKSEESLYENHPVLYIFAFGLVAAKITNKLVVAHMSKSELEYFDSSMVGPAMLFLNQYFDCFIQEYYVLWACLVWVTADLVWYCSRVCLQISEYLHIEVFRITPGGGHSHHSNNGTPVSSDSSETDKVASTGRVTRSRRQLL